MPADATAHIRIARPSRDLQAAEDFWTSGLGLDVLYRYTTDGTDGEHSLLMVGWLDASWHLELVHDPVAPIQPRPTPEDLLVIYLGEPVPDALVERLERHGGKRVPAHNPYWDTWGVTFQDPDGYLLVLSTRAWSSS
ncbi:VOC family protein [Actinopolymorpha pittospori]|uniref:Catechol 2,3-dioxygenase-like lactoylglutathione lyase family enzyme n=1 Tax=Actinopolymorpha pittospori TaxID=648752 RepID=A0A927R7S8_9ACTN|nr:VOC family protein [Actinopolymorpha pittospori]MBE1605897.1 catechol 2,3-dioxygenase-like lactoylglutathione lyase family enzyme [Actinopolymorpha pittospori]